MDTQLSSYTSVQTIQSPASEPSNYILKDRTGSYLIVRDASRYAPTSNQRAATRFLRDRAHKFAKSHRSEGVVVVRLTKKPRLN